MPLDEFQKQVVAVLMPLRSPDSTFAGGVVLQRHGFRMSDDQDIFHDADADISAIARRDVEALKSAGFEVDISRSFEGLTEAFVTRGVESATRIQWVQSGTWNFFKPVPDEMFGWRLHMADLAVNKGLAAAARHQVRDFIDLALIHQHMIPLWHVCWAAPAKDPDWSPLSLVERISANAGFRQEDVDSAILATFDIDIGRIAATVRDGLDQARELIKRVPPSLVGKMFVDDDGGVVNDIDRILSGRVNAIDAEKGGAWPSSVDIDHAIIGRLVDAFGWDGLKEPSYDPFRKP